MKPIRTATVTRALRRFVQLLALLTAMNYANGNYPLGFAIVALCGLYGLWRLGHGIIIVNSRRGRMYLNQIF